VTVSDELNRRVMPGGIVLPEWLDYWESDAAPWVDDEIDLSNAFLGEIQAAVSAIRELQAENARLRDALNRIATSDHCRYETNGNSSYGLGVTDGHRCAAQDARNALNAPAAQPPRGDEATSGEGG